MSRRYNGSPELSLQERLAAEQFARASIAKLYEAGAQERAERWERGARAERAAPNLDYRTHLSDSRVSKRASFVEDLHGPRKVSEISDDEPRWKVTSLDFGHGLVEARCVYLDGPAPRTNGKRNADGVRKEESCIRSFRRASSSLRRRLYALRPEYLLTFTKRGKFPTIEDAQKAFRSFAKMMSAEFGEEWRYVAVPEMHATFGWHIHVAVHNRFDVSRMRLFWHRALGAARIRVPLMGEESPGNVEARKRKHWQTPDRLAFYLSKYLSKSIVERGIFKKAFWASPGLSPLRVVSFNVPVCAYGVPLYEVRCLLEDSFGLEFECYEWKDSHLQGFTLKSKVAVHGTGNQN